MLARLQHVGVLRRSKEPDLDLLAELFAAHAKRLACAACGHIGLSTRGCDADDWDDDDWDDWGAGRACEVCGQPILSERLQVFPAASRCAACQQQEEAGGNVELEYCPRCGEVMTIRARASGASRYVMSCPKCKYVS